MASTTSAALSPRANARSTTNGISTSNGQCQRYAEYDTPPTNWTGRSVSTGVGEARPDGVPAQTTATAPRTGSSAATPG